MSEPYSEIDHERIEFDVISEDGCKEVNLHRLHPSFMYSQILKDIILQFDDRSQAKQELVDFYRDKYADFPPNLKLIDQFEREYAAHTSIQWYTRENFVYSILNEALRQNDIQTLHTTRLLLRDIHRQLEEMYRKMSPATVPKKLFRGQGISNQDFEKLKNNIGGLISFNSFLSTSVCEDVPKMFADCTNANTTGILFEIEIDSFVRSSPFASLDDVHHLGMAEKEFLFSMHTVFRILDIVDNAQCPLVRLKLTADGDPQLRQLTEYIHKNIQEEGTAQQRLVLLMYQMGKYDLATQFLEKLLAQAYKDTKITEVGVIVHHLGQIIADMGHYDQSIIHYQKANNILQSYLPEKHPLQIKIICNLATTYQQQGNYVKALQLYKNASELLLQCENRSNEDLFGVYVHIGLIHREQGHIEEALCSFQNADKVRRQSLPPNHPRLAALYNNMGLVFYDQDDLPQALCYINRCIEIQNKSLPDLHGDRALPKVSKGLIHCKQDEIGKAICQFEQAIDIQMQCLRPNHPDMAFAYGNLGTCYRNQNNHEKAIEYHKKCLDIQLENLPPNHPAIAITYNNLGETQSSEKPDEALSAFEKALSIQAKSLPLDHPDVALVYSNMGLTYAIKKDYLQAETCLEKSLNIRCKSLPDNVSFIVSSYENMIEILCHTRKYEKAFEYAKSAVEICRRYLPLENLQRRNFEEMFEAMNSRRNAVLSQKFSNSGTDLK